MVHAISDARVGGPDAEELVAFVDGSCDVGVWDAGEARVAVDAEEDHGGAVCPGSWEESQFGSVEVEL